MNRFFRSSLIVLCSFFSISAAAVCGVPQDLINAASAGSTLDFTGCAAQYGTISISKSLHIVGLTLNSPHGASAVIVNADNVTLERVTLRGPQATSYDGSAIGVSARGSSTRPVRNLKVIDSVITRYGSNAMDLHYIYDAQILRNRIEDSVYAGIMMLSAVRGLVQGNTVRRIGVYGAQENSNNAYGIAISQTSGGPQSTDVVVDGNIVEDVPTWNGLDTHAGIRIKFTNNIVRRARRGIFVTGNSSGQRNYDCITENNRLEGPVGGTEYGITYVFSTGGAIRNNNIIGYQSGKEILLSSSGLPDATAINVTVSGNYNNPSAPLPISSPTPIQAPVIKLSSSSLSFADQLVGSTSSVQIVTITNTGTGPLTFKSNFSITGDFGFGNLGTCALEVSYAPGQSCTASVVFAPTISGLRSGALTIESNATSSPVTVSLSGSGVAPVMTDTTAPMTAIVSPSHGSYVSVRTVISIQATATDNVGVQRVEFYVNGRLVCASSAMPYQCAWRVPKNRRKVYTLQTKARDAAGNVGSSSLVRVTSR